MAEKVGVACDTVVVVDPGRHEHATLEHEPLLMIGDRESIEQPLEREAHQHNVENPALDAREVQQPVLDRSGEIDGYLSHWR